MKTTILFIFIILISYSCSLGRFNNVPVQNEIDLSFKKFTEIKKEEISQKSKDITLGYFWGIGEDIYPTFAKHTFEIPKSYQRNENNFILKVDYFFTKDDQTQFKFYEWNENKKAEISAHQFDEKFYEIKKYVTENLGQPYLEIYEDLEKSKEETVRDDIKWRNQKLNAYLFRFRGKGGFDQIRLAIYKD
ncbi:hypothetical protein [Chryseobacterium sp.]|uniref:hypothetical protein n=1 Tax=Chryseobacterium sp. TaxID=1871047 RepID=UPI0025C1CB3E|nr:hypothetical protein [Chryseobacterium sp.]MBV8327998.1 hypothetical protein [Chryseobacterium sp.]